MDEDTADGKPRAFFTSMAPPDPGTHKPLLQPPHSKRLNSRGQRRRRSSFYSQPREWWDSLPSSRGRRQSPAKDFDFDVPEHLPSSPMCPTNSRHKSGGTGLCVYHGRRLGASGLRNETGLAAPSLQDEAGGSGRALLSGGIY